MMGTLEVPLIINDRLGDSEVPETAAQVCEFLERL